MHAVSTFMKKNLKFFLQHSKKTYFCSRKTMPNGVMAAQLTLDQLVSVRILVGQQKSRTFPFGFFYFSAQFNPKCILILETRISTTTGLEPRGSMMSAVRLVGSMNCWCMGLTKV